MVKFSCKTQRATGNEQGRTLQQRKQKARHHACTARPGSVGGDRKEKAVFPGRGRGALLHPAGGRVAA